MKNLQKMGGISALIAAATYMIGFALVFTLLAPILDEIEPSKYVAFLADNHVLMYVWNMLIYVVNGIFLVILTLALHDRLKLETPALSQVATAFGLIWSTLVIASGMLILINLGTVVDVYAQDVVQAELVWQTLSSVENGLGGGIEIVGGIWILLLSWAALQSKALPTALNSLGVIIGLAGILTIIPPLESVGAIFGLGFILWFLAVGVVMLRTPTQSRAIAPSETWATQ